MTKGFPMANASGPQKMCVMIASFLINIDIYIHVEMNIAILKTDFLML